MNKFKNVRVSRNSTKVSLMIKQTCLRARMSDFREDFVDIQVAVLHISGDHNHVSRYKSYSN